MVFMWQLVHLGIQGNENMDKLVKEVVRMWKLLSVNQLQQYQENVIKGRDKGVDV